MFIKTRVDDSSRALAVVPVWLPPWLLLTMLLDWVSVRFLVLPVPKPNLLQASGVFVETLLIPRFADLQVCPRKMSGNQGRDIGAKPAGVSSIGGAIISL